MDGMKQLKEAKLIKPAVSSAVIGIFSEVQTLMPGENPICLLRLCQILGVRRSIQTSVILIPRLVLVTD